MTVDRLLRILGLIIGTALVSGCEVGPQPPTSGKRLVSQSTTCADPGKQRAFRPALKNAGVPHEIYTGDDGREYVRCIRAQLFGAPYQEWFKT